MESTIEQWKSVDGFENYLISNKGRVFREKSEFLMKGKYRFLKKEKFINFENINGYNRVALYKEGKRTRILVHVLVARAFLLKIDGKTEVNHKNGIKNDNRVENLEWCNRSENTYHSYNVLKQKKPNSKFTDEQILKIRELRKEGHKMTDLAKKYNVVHSTISEIINLKRYK